MLKYKIPDELAIDAYPLLDKLVLYWLDDPAFGKYLISRRYDYRNHVTLLTVQFEDAHDEIVCKLKGVPEQVSKYVLPA